MKIVLITGLSNKEVRNHLVFKKESWLFHLLIRLLGLPARVGFFSDKASWAMDIINDLKKRSNIELYVLAPHIRLKHKTQDFEIDGVQYHYFSAEITSFLRLFKNYRLWKWLQMSKRYAKIYLDKIRPDLVILSGAENPVTSGAIFGAERYPRICLCQTVYNDPDINKFFRPDRLRQQLELDIFKTLEFFGVYCRKHYNLLLSNSSEKKVFRFNYPTTTTLLQPLNLKKEYDFVNFAQLHSVAKGSLDSVRALAIVKQLFPNVTLNIVGGCDKTMRVEFDRIIHDNKLEGNVIFTPFFEQKEDLLKHIQKSRFAVLPCKLDNTSGTMSQCMMLNIPIVVYKTSGTPAFNKLKQCALIADMNNVEELAHHMITLMKNPELANELAKNGRWFKESQVQLHIDNWNTMVDNFAFIIDNFKHGTPIPTERLYDPNRDN